MNTRRDFLKAAALVPAGFECIDAAEPETALELWYRQPAPDWNEALPIGNGRLGAMIFGGIETEHLQLNDNTLYSDEPGRRDLDLDVTKGFDDVVRMLRGRQYKEAGEFITKYWGGRVQPCYQPLADLYIEFAGPTAASGYRRELDLATAVSYVRYASGGVQYTREIFASHPDQVIVIRLSASRPGTLTFRAVLRSIHPTAKAAVRDAATIALTGQVPGFVLRRTLEWVEKRGEQWKYPELWDRDGKRRPNAKTVLYGDEIGGLGTRFEARLRAVATGGTVDARPEGLAVSGASEVVLILAAATSYNGFDKRPSKAGADPGARAGAHLDAAAKKTYNALRQAHIADYKRLFDRLSLTLGESTDQSRLPTDERIAHFANHQLLIDDVVHGLAVGIVGR